LELNIEPLAAAGFAVYAYDQPGFWLYRKSSDHSIEYRSPTRKALINALGLGQFHVVGNQWEVYYRRRLALEISRVKGFVTTTSGSFVPQGSADSHHMKLT